MKKQYKKILSIIFIILFITLTPIVSYFNIENNVYANDLLLEGISKKVTATILASMGVLGYVTQNIGIDEFYQGLIEFNEDVKGIIDLPQKLFQIGYTAITTSAKMKVNSVKNNIIEYYNSIRDEIINDIPIAPTIPGAKAIYESFKEGLIQQILPVDNPSNILNKTYIGQDYYLQTTGYVTRDSSYNWWPVFRINYKHNGTTINNTHFDFPITSFKSQNNDKVKLIYKVQSTINSIVIDAMLINLTKNTIKVDRMEKTFNDLVGLIEYPDILDKTKDIPIAKSVPTGLTLPWELTINTEDVLGLNIEQLLEVINNLQLEEYLDRLLDLPKSIVDAMNPPEVKVEDGVISGVTDTTWDDVLAEGKEHTTILERIADRIDVLINKVDDFFNPEKNPPGNNDDNGTDWGNFKNFFDIFWIFYYLIILAIIMLLKFFSVIMSILTIPANTALFDQYPTMLSGLNYIKNIKVGGFTVTLQTIFEYMFTVFFFLYIVTTLQKLYHSFMGIERIQRRENEREARFEKYDNERHYEPNNFTKGIMHANEQKPNNGLSFKDDDYENIKFTGWGD